MGSPANSNVGGNRTVSFPSTSTILVGLWLLAYTVVAGIALYMSFGSGFILKYSKVAADSSPFFYREASIAVYAAGVGSAITTMLGYLDHASIRKDFDIAYIPWYVARPLIGMLLGLIFYFVLRGGLIVIQIGETSSANEPFNTWSIAAISALVGLFSKNAVEKLRELFNTLFQSKDDVYTDLLERLPPGLRKTVLPYIPKGKGYGKDSSANSPTDQ